MWIQKKGYSKKVLLTDDEAGVQAQLAKIGQNEKIHFHKSKTELFYFLRGEGVATIDGEKTKVKAGSFLAIKPNQVHHIEPKSKEIKVFMVKINSKPEDTYFI
jgi:quercetin dioxygenase-like cupin family protein